MQSVVSAVGNILPFNFACEYLLTTKSTSRALLKVGK